VWFAAGVQQRCWDSAQVFRIAHGHEIETGLFGGYKEGRITWSCFFFCTVKDIAIPAESEKLKESYFKRREQSHPWKLVVGRRPHIGGRESLCAMITDNDLSSDDFLIGYVPLPKNEETLGKLKAVRADQECRPKRSVSITTVRCHGGSGIAGPTASMDSRVQLGTCMYACALLVAADGRVTEKELQIVVGGLSWSGLESTELKQKFVEACKRVRQEGASKWSGIVTTTLAEETNGAQSGMPKSDLRKLLTRLVDSEPADSREKQELFNAIQAGFASSRSAAKPTRRVQNPWTGENQ